MENLLSKVSIDNIYTTITDLEGPRYPLDNMKELNEAADYIIEKLQSYGVSTEIQEFHIAGMEEPFRNIIGRIGDPLKPATLIGSHYDTVRDTPGANDNLSAVAVSLEVARVLSTMENPPTVIVAAFTLEEGHPSVRKEIDEKLLTLGLIDKKHRFTSAKLLRFSKLLRSRYLEMRKNGAKSVVEIYSKLFEELKGDLTKDEVSYLETFLHVYKKYTDISPINRPSYTVGSYRYAESVENIKQAIKDVIVFDCLGWVNPESKKSNALPINDQLKSFIKSYDVDLSNAKGNFIAVFGEKNSSAMLENFISNFKDESVNIPYLGLALPLEYEAIRKAVPDVLRSDHWPFWRKGVPGIFVSDMANFRSDYYHTPADQSKYINFEVLKKIAGVTIMTLLADAGH